jgi:DNA repair exonuclease SbcCD ATPase subunit
MTQEELKLRVKNRLKNFRHRIEMIEQELNFIKERMSAVEEQTQVTELGLQELESWEELQ